MSASYKVLLVCSLFLFSLFIPIFSSSLYESNDSSEILKDSVLSAFDNYSPISISGNSDFSTKASNFGWQGNGSEQNPYIITQINITQHNTPINLLEVDNTEVYFIINASLFVGGADAIHLTNVANGRIVYNTIYHTISSGIYFSNCVNCTIENNTITDNANRGILIDFSENCTVEENTIEDCTGDGLK
ncbi:MAG: right-handed parallel beta-helix repeat-containing protein, partial [Candidatus Thorarchaeota archaeon]